MRASTTANSDTWDDAMRDETTDGLTELLNAYSESDDDARSEMFRRIYFELRRRAEQYMSDQPRNHSLRATGLVHDVYLKLFRGEEVHWKNRRHFFAVAAKAMRSVLVDHARAKRRKKRSSGGARSALDQLLDDCQSRLQDKMVDLLDLDAALKDLETQDPRAYEVVHNRFFLGLPMHEIAIVMGIPQRTVERDWTFARAWIANRLLRARENE